MATEEVDSSTGSYMGVREAPDVLHHAHLETGSLKIERSDGLEQI